VRPKSAANFSSKPDIVAIIKIQCGEEHAQAQRKLDAYVQMLDNGVDPHGIKISSQIVKQIQNESLESLNHTREQATKYRKSSEFI